MLKGWYERALFVRKSTLEVNNSKTVARNKRWEWTKLSTWPLCEFHCDNYTTSARKEVNLRHRSSVYARKRLSTTVPNTSVRLWKITGKIKDLHHYSLRKVKRSMFEPHTADVPFYSKSDLSRFILTLLEHLKRKKVLLQNFQSALARPLLLTSQSKEILDPRFKVPFPTE